MVVVAAFKKRSPAPEEMRVLEALRVPETWSLETDEEAVEIKPADNVARSVTPRVLDSVAAPPTIKVDEAERAFWTLRLALMVEDAVEMKPEMRPEASMVKRSAPPGPSKFRKLPVNPVVEEALIRLPEVVVARTEKR